MREASTVREINSCIHSTWKAVRFYEETTKKPPLILRIILPIPKRVVGDHSIEGGISKCEYSDGAFIVKEVTSLVKPSKLEFIVVENSYHFDRLIRLCGGKILLIEETSNKTKIIMTTYYENTSFLNSLLEPFIKLIIRSLHKFVIQEINYSI